jgi:hypothetical protein
MRFATYGILFMRVIRRYMRALGQTFYIPLFCQMKALLLMRSNHQLKGISLKIKPAVIDPVNALSISFSSQIRSNISETRKPPVVHGAVTSFLPQSRSLAYLAHLIIGATFSSNVTVVWQIQLDAQSKNFEDTVGTATNDFQDFTVRKDGNRFLVRNNDGFDCFCVYFAN